MLGVACGESASCAELNCDDANPCTSDSCNSERVLCESADLPDQTGCAIDGVEGLCSAGLCASLSCDGTTCDDANPCTRDACFPGTMNCAHFPLPTLTLCEIDGAFGTCRENACDLTLPPSGDAALDVSLTGVDASSIEYRLMCAGDVTLFGNLARIGSQWNASLTLPAGACTAQFSAKDADGETICSAEIAFEVAPGSVVPVKIVLLCSV